MRISKLLLPAILLCSSGLAVAQDAAPAPPAARGEGHAVAVAGEPGTYVFSFSGGSYIGVATANVTNENAGRLGLGEPRGVVIERVIDDSPASKAGLQKDDVILRFEGEDVTSVAKLTRLIGEVAPDHKAKMRISRGGREQDVTITVGQRKGPMAWNGTLNGALGDRYSAELNNLSQMNPEALSELRTKLGNGQFTPFERGQNMAWAFGGGRRVGISTIALTKQLAEFFGVPGGEGVLVTSVNENSPAAKSGLKAGDVITDVDGQKVNDSGDVSRGINKKAEGDVTLTVIRDRGQRMMTVTPEKSTTGYFPNGGGLLTPSVVVKPRVQVGTPNLNITPRTNITPRVRVTPRSIFGTSNGTVIL